MGRSRLERGQSDPITYKCTCHVSSVGGTVLLFYRYWANTPQLPADELPKTADPESLAAWHRAQTTKHHLTGKLRISKEGYNITVAGAQDEISRYTAACAAHWSFAGLALGTPAERDAFFKPSRGCACVFGPPAHGASVRVTAEITPMGVEGYAPADWAAVEAVAPAEFHRRCLEEAPLLLDVRNAYESRIGYFVEPRTGEPALRPRIRRFSQWPLFVRRRWQEVEERLVGADGRGQEQRQIMTYCTGGIRCEKATRWMHEVVGVQRGRKICTLQGGIAAYLTWMDGEIKEGRKQASESLFKGRNYVFDARGSTGLSALDSTEFVSTCSMCGEPTANMTKCGSVGCHLILVVCSACDAKEARCCADCNWIDVTATESENGKPRPMCACELEREKELWGQEPRKLSTAQLKEKRKGKAETQDKASLDRIDIPIKII